MLDTGIDAAAAMLYAFARYPRCFPLALSAMPAMLAKNAASREGMRLEADAKAFRELVMGVTSRQYSADDVDAWVRDRLVPLQPREV